MSEYKTKTIELPEFQGNVTSLAQIHAALPAVLPDHDEAGWEVCAVLAAQFYTDPVKIGVVYRKIDDER